jgi:hypothetical protein
MKTLTKTVQGVTFQGRDYEVKSIKANANAIFQMDHIGQCPELRPYQGHMPYVYRDATGNLYAMAVGPKSESPNCFWRLLP